MRYEAAELAMRDSALAATGMPRLDAFDEEFGREPVAVLRGHRRRGVRFSTVIGAALGAAIITALAWPWMKDGGLGSEVRALLPVALSAPHDSATGQVEQLVREVESLKREIADLTEARQQALDRIESLEAAEQSTHEAPLAYWYSDPAALRYGLAGPTGSNGVASATSRRSPTARTEGRTEARDARRREGAAPLSLEAPQ
jgi:hypothetical protein